MIKFIKKQFSRGWNLIKSLWNLLLFDTEFNDEYFTTFGKWCMYLMGGFMLSMFTLIIILFMPIILATIKHDDSIGF